MGRVGAPTRCARRVCQSLSPGTPASTNLPRVPPLFVTMASESPPTKTGASGVKTLANKVHTAAAASGVQACRTRAGLLLTSLASTRTGGC